MISPDVDPGWVVARLARLVESSIGDLDLTLPQYRVLTILARGSEGAAALATKLVVSPATVTSVVDGLVARGLVQREADASDRRKVAHVLAPAGRDVLDLARVRASDRLNELAGYLDKADADAAIAALGHWQQALTNYRLAIRSGVTAAPESHPSAPETHPSAAETHPSAADLVGVRPGGLDR